MKIKNIRLISLAWAESFDAWRIIPRLMLIAYSALTVKLYTWYISIPTFIQQKCDAAVLKIFIDGGMPLAHAQSLACTVVDVVGGPTPAQSAFVTTIIGLSTGIFGLYTSTGKRWEAVDFSRNQISTNTEPAATQNSSSTTPSTTPSTI
jgi:hypothetical protein